MNSILESAEIGIVGRAILDPSIVDHVALLPEMFNNKNCAKMWGTILHLVGLDNAVDEVSLASALASERPEDESFWMGLVTRAIGGALLPGLEDSASQSISQHFTSRRLRRTLSEATDEAVYVDDIGDLVQRTIYALEELQQIGGIEHPDLHEEIIDEIADIAAGKGRSAGLPSGVGLERVVPGGIPRDKVTIFFGETGTFKTTLKANVIDAIAFSDAGLVLDFSLEDSNELTRQRALARASGVPYSRFATREFAKADLDAIDAIDKQALRAYKNVVVIGDIPPTADEIIRTARRYTRRGLAAVVVDYVTLLDWGGRTEREMLNESMVKFQRAAKRDNVAYIIVSQVNDEKIHGDPKRSDKRPQLRDIFGSSAIKNTCKLAVGVYRPAKYGPPKRGRDLDLYGDMFEKNPAEYADLIELVIRKNVLGRDNVAVQVACDRPTGKMKPYAQGYKAQGVD
jgi:replicative DNA helicase